MPVGARWQVHVSNPQGESLQIHDVVYDHGKPSEITDDWYAQDTEGNIWYFGEDTVSIENGKKDTSAMPAHSGAGGSLHRRDPDG